MYVFAVAVLVPGDERSHQRTNLIQLLQRDRHLNGWGHDELYLADPREYLRRLTYKLTGEPPVRLSAALETFLACMLSAYYCFKLLANERK